MVGGSIYAFFYKIVRRAPEKTRSALSLIAGIKRILSVIRESLGQRFLYNSWPYHISADILPISYDGWSV